MIAPTRLSGDGRPGPNVRMFSVRFRVTWALLFVVTVLCEITPRSPSLPPLPYYVYTGSKAVLF